MLYRLLRDKIIGRILRHSTPFQIYYNLMLFGSFLIHDMLQAIVLYCPTALDDDPLNRFLPGIVFFIDFPLWLFRLLWIKFFTVLFVCLNFNIRYFIFQRTMLTLYISVVHFKDLQTTRTTTVRLNCMRLLKIENFDIFY